MEDFSKYANLENYLFNEVRLKFETNGQLNVFDFFCIVFGEAIEQNLELQIYY